MYIFFGCPSFATMMVSPDESRLLPKRRDQDVDVCAKSSSPQSSIHARYFRWREKSYGDLYLVGGAGNTRRSSLF